MRQIWLAVAALIVSHQVTFADEIALPPDVTIQHTVGGSVFADAKGRSLYIAANRYGLASAKGCVGFSTRSDCPVLYQPLIASSDAKAVGDWTIVKPKDGDKLQWAYRASPVYTYMLEAGPGTINGELVNIMVAGGRAKAVRVPESMPADIALYTTSIGDVLVDVNGMPLYAMSKQGRSSACTDDCLLTWRPLLAAAMSHDMGAFTTITREGGNKQWAYKGQPLYTYANDEARSALSGDGRDGLWHAVLAVPKEEPPSFVRIERSMLGLVYADKDGKSMYSYENLLPEQNLTPITSLCRDQCDQVWHAVLVPDGAKLSGSWSRILRPDKSRQLAFRSLPLYTYATDAVPGDMEGDHYGGGGDHGFSPILAGPARKD